jgi:hypothetical protein
MTAHDELIGKLEAEAFNPTGDDRMGKFVRLDKAIAIIHQHFAEHYECESSMKEDREAFAEAGHQRREIPVIAELHSKIAELIAPGQIYEVDPLAAKVMDFIKPYLCHHKPVSIAQCYMAFKSKRSLMFLPDGSTQEDVDWKGGVKAVLDAAGVKYVED